MENLTLYELGQVFTLYDRALEENNQEHYIELLATLFRPAKPATKENKRSGYQGDCRLPFLNHESTVKKRRSRIKNMEPNLRSFLLFWFTCCRLAIVQTHADIFTGGAGKKDPYGYGGLILSLSDGLANVDAVASQNYATAFVYLSKLENDRREREAAQR